MSSYCDPIDLPAYAIPQASADALQNADKLSAIAAASAEMDGYFAARFTLPITAWSNDVRRQCAVMAGADLLRSKLGFASDGGPNSFDMARASAVAWLKGVAAGTITPPGIVDSSVVSDAGNSYTMVTNAPRGW